MRNLILYKKVSSTNNIIKEYELETIVQAQSQTAGKGRYFNTWISPKGGLYFSYKTKFSENIIFTLIPIIVGIACHKVLQTLSSERIYLKWPNDLLNEEKKKIGGILIEKDKNKNLIIGIGINLFAQELKENKNFDNLKIKDQNLSKIWILSEIEKEISKYKQDFIKNKDEIFVYWKKASLYKKGDLISFLYNKDNKISGEIIELADDGRLLVKVETEFLYLDFSQIRNIMLIPS